VLIFSIGFGNHPNLQGWMDHINSEKFLLQHTFSRKVQILSKYDPNQIQSVVSGWSLGERDKRVWSAMPKTVLWPVLIDLVRIPFYGRHLNVSMVFEWFEFSPIFEVRYQLYSLKTTLNAKKIFCLILGDATQQIARIEKNMQFGQSAPNFTLHPENIYGMFYKKHCQGEYSDFLKVACSANVQVLVTGLGVSTYEEWWNWVVSPEEPNLLGETAYVYGPRVRLVSHLPAFSDSTDCQLITPHALDMSLNQWLCRLLRQAKAVMSFVGIYMSFLLLLIAS
jgi:hypothetical protein